MTYTDYPAKGPVGEHFKEFMTGMVDATLADRGAMPSVDEVVLWHQCFLAGASATSLTLAETFTPGKLSMIVKEIEEMNGSMQRARSWIDEYQSALGVR